MYTSWDNGINHSIYKSWVYVSSTNKADTEYGMQNYRKPTTHNSSIFALIV